MLLSGASGWRRTAGSSTRIFPYSRRGGQSGEDPARVLRLASLCTDEAEEVWRNFLLSDVIRDD
jgi:hypothetical protein